MKRFRSQFDKNVILGDTSIEGEKHIANYRKSTISSRNQLAERVRSSSPAGKDRKSKHKSTSEEQFQEKLREAFKVPENVQTQQRLAFEKILQNMIVKKELKDLKDEILVDLHEQQVNGVIMAFAEPTIKTTNFYDGEDKLCTLVANFDSGLPNYKVQKLKDRIAKEREELRKQRALEQH